MELYEVLTKRIQELVAQKGITINKLLKDCGFNTSLFYDLRKGAVPSAEKIVKIAEYFNVTTDDLLGREKPRRFEINIEGLSEEAKEDLKKYIEFLRMRYSNK